MSVARSVLADQARSVAVGLALGLLGARLAAPVLGRFVFGVGPSDPLSFAAAAVALVAMAAGAASLPIRSAVRTDPGILMRDVR